MKKNEKFVNISFTAENLDVYIIRHAIFNELNRNLKYFKENLLDLGCGKMPYRQYILKNSRVNHYVGLDLENSLSYDPNVMPDQIWNGIEIPFPNNKFSTVMATEVLEHCPDPQLVIQEIYRVLRPGGIFFFTVPFLWNLHEVPNDEYRYTPFALERHLKNSQFSEIIINATGGWHASMAQMLGLWVKRSPMQEKKRKFLMKMIHPLMKYLLNLDEQNEVVFKEGQMITGLCGTAMKYQ